MSFLLLAPHEEEQAVLADALAFIDTFAFDCDDVTEESSTNSSSGELSDVSADSDRSLYVEVRIPKSSVSDSNSSSDCSNSAPSTPPLCTTNESSSSSSSSNANTPVDAPLEQKKLLRNRALNTRAVLRYRNRTKMEIAALHDELLQLNALLAKLQRRPTATASAASSDALTRQTHMTPLLQLESASSVGIEDAVSEYKRLQQAEALNRRLKDAVRKQRSVSATLERIFKRQVAKHDLTFVMDIEKMLTPKAPAQTQLVAAWDDARVFHELALHLQHVVYRSTDTMVAQIQQHNSVDCAFHNTCVTLDARVGKTLAFASNTPVASALRDLDAKLWDFLTYPGASAAAPDRDNMRFSMPFDCKLDDVRADGVTAVRKFVEPHRVVLVFTSLIAPVASGLVFRETGWIVLSDATVSGCTTAPTLFQTMYRVHAEPRTGSATLTMPMPPGLAALHDYVLRAQGDKMSAFQRSIQNWLLYAFDTAAVTATQEKGFLGSCMADVPCVS